MKTKPQRQSSAVTHKKYISKRWGRTVHSFSTAVYSTVSPTFSDL